MTGDPPRSSHRLGRSRLFAPWLAFSAACVAGMWLSPSLEVVPFHLIWIAFALAYGFEPWPIRRTTVALVVIAVVSGAIFVDRARTGHIAWAETSEIALMLLLAGLVMWHVRRRHAAIAEIAKLAEQRLAAARERVRLSRLTSHEMRTPLTLAIGYVDLLLRREHRLDVRHDLEVVRDELGRLARGSERLLRMIRLQDVLERSTIDLDLVMNETADRWAAVAHRNWVVEPGGVMLEGSLERLRAILDTLIENAVRYTDDGATVRLFSSRDGDVVRFGVADSGPGFAPEHAALLTSASPAALANDREPLDAAGAGSGTGFGLGIVREIVEARGGAVAVGRSREGGALVLVSVPDPVPPAVSLEGSRLGGAASDSVNL